MKSKWRKTKVIYTFLKVIHSSVSQEPSLIDFHFHYHPLDLTEAELRGSANTSPEPEKIPTVPVSEDSVKPEGEGTCSICKEEFDQFFKEGTDDDDDGKWHYRNAIFVEDEGIFHPQCHADKANSQHNFLIDESFHEDEEEEQQPSSMAVIDGDVPMEEPVPEPSEKQVQPEVKPEPDQEMTDLSEDTTEKDLAVPMEPTVQSEPESSSVLVKEENPGSPSKEADSEPIETIKTESSEMETKVKVEPPKEEPEEGVESQVETQLSDETKEKEAQPEEQPVPTHENSLEDSSMIAPSMSQEPVGPKPGIKINITSQVELERRESIVSNQSDKESVENSEFDPEAIVQEAKLDLDVLKPKLKDRKFTELPPQNRGQELSGLCSIM